MLGPIGGKAPGGLAFDEVWAKSCALEGAMLGRNGLESGESGDGFEENSLARTFTVHSRTLDV